MKYAKLGDYCTITSSKRIFAEQYVDSGIPFYRSKEIIEKQEGKNISKPLYISEAVYSQIKNKFGVPKQGDVLLTSVGTLGVPYVVKSEEEFYFKDGNLTWLKDFSSEINAEYIYYWFVSEFGRQSLINKSIGSSQGAITIDILKKYKLLVPEKNIQDSIVTILSAYDELIENNNKRIKVLEQMVQSVYKEWFVRFRFPQYEKAEFEGDIPKGWNQMRLGDFGITLDSGSRPSGGIDGDLREGMPSLGAEAVNGLAEFDYSSVKYIPADFYVKMKRGKNTGNDILVYKDGAYIGKTTLFRNEFPFEHYAVNEHVFLLNANNVAYQNYLYFTLHQPAYYTLMQNLNRNAAQPGLSKPDVKRIKIIVPKISIVKRFNDFVEPILNTIFDLAKQNQNLAKQRDMLLPRLMSGKLKV